MSDPIALVIAQVNAAGYYFNNLFQLASGQWRCNLRSDIMIPSHTDYGTGPDPVTAVHEALRKMLADRPREKVIVEDETAFDIPAFLRRQQVVIADDDLIGGPAPNNVAYADEDLGDLIG